MSQLVIGVPGPWKDREDAIRALVRANRNPESPRFLPAGDSITDMATGKSLGLDVYEHDPGMRRAFECAGQGRFSSDELSAINDHSHTIYLVCGEPFNSPSRDGLAAARVLLELGVFVLDAGGIAVKVESTGTAHPADRWRYYAEQATTLSKYDAFVTMVGGDKFNYTCGMHTFGLPDVSLTTDVSIEEAPCILNGFNQYQLLESPELSNGSIFAMSQTEPPLILSHHDYGYDEDELLNNPFGRWHLELSPEPLPANETKYQSGGQPMFMALGKDDPTVIKSIEQARASLPWFLQHFHSQYEYGSHLVKTRIRDGEDSAYIWSALVDTKGDELTAELFEMPPEFKNYKAGQQLVVHIDDVYDWCIQRNGTMIGGFSRRLQREHIPPEERQQFDLYAGIIAFAPVEEILRQS